MKCEQVRVLLSSYIDGITSEKENRFINEHLQSCPQCQSELKQLKSCCAVLMNLPAPELPESFIDDLRKHLAEEKTILYKPRGIKKPQRQGWIAASIAGMALALGIYVSSVLPVAPIIAAWQEKHDNSNSKTVGTINEIINRIQTAKVEKSENIAQVTDEPQEVEKKNNNISNNTSINSVQFENNEGNNANNDNNEEPVKIANVEAAPKIADVYSTRITVSNAADSLNEVVQLAENNGWNYDYSDNGSITQALSASNVSGITLKVDREEVNNVISALGEIGKASAPLQEHQELTQKYSEIEKQIITLQEKKQDLQKAKSPDENELKEIETQIHDCLQQKETLDKDLTTATVYIYLEEEVAP
ncbi:MAG: zf-HC2 domain-containing protein [Syntrophomonadaceae bacterium]|jgi:hypothetical protein